MEVVLRYFPSLSSSQISLLEHFFLLFQKWNQQVNLISKKDIVNFWERHLLHSLSIGKFIQFSKGTTVLDLGTGGGLPGLPLAILYPDVKFTLVDSIHKKIKIVEKMVEELKLTHVSCKTLRIEEEQGYYDFVLTRAVAKMDTLKQWVKPILSKKSFNIRENGLIALKGGILSEELINSPTASVTSISNYFTEPFFETKQIVYLPISKF